MTTTDPDPLLTVRETAERLRCSERTVRQLIADRELHHVRVGKLVRVPHSSLSTYLTSCAVPTTQHR